MKVKVRVRRKNRDEVCESIPISTEFIKLESLLKLANIAETGGEAKLMIQDGDVLVNGEVCLARGKKLRPGDRVTVDGKNFMVAENS